MLWKRKVGVCSQSMCIRTRMDREKNEEIRLIIGVNDDLDM